MRRRNPDNQQLQLERDYRNSGSIYDGAKLLSVYVRTGQADSANELLSVMEATYAEGATKDLTLEAAIVSAYVGLGRNTQELCNGGKVVCRYVDFLPPPRQAGWGIPEET